MVYALGKRRPKVRSRECIERRRKSDHLMLYWKVSDSVLGIGAWRDQGNQSQASAKYGIPAVRLPPL